MKNTQSNTDQDTGSVDLQTRRAFIGTLAPAVIFMAISKLSASSEQKPAATMHDFGKTSDGKIAKAYSLKNRNGVEVTLSDFGATVVSFQAPDRGPQCRIL